MTIFRCYYFDDTLVLWADVLVTAVLRGPSAVRRVRLFPYPMSDISNIVSCY